MKKTLLEYQEAILRLPIKEKYEKQEILIPDFWVDQEMDVEIYYAPHNEYRNQNAKIFIIGITPGFQQMSTALATARKGFAAQHSISQIQYDCKVAGRFSGVIRKNIIEMLEELGLPKRLNIQSAKDLFGSRDDLLHTISLIPYSVFVKGQNYSGHTPKLMKSDFLMKYVKESFIEEYGSLHTKEQVLLIPLGRAVEEVLEQLVNEGVLGKHQILRGFPHPSGANVNRLSQFQAEKQTMELFLNTFYQV